VFASVGPQPFHIGDDAGSRNGVAAAQRPIVAPVTSPPIDLPVMYSAMARRSGPLRREPWTRIAPFTSASMMASGDRGLRASGDGARDPSSPL